MNTVVLLIKTSVADKIRLWDRENNRLGEERKSGDNSPCFMN